MRDLKISTGITVGLCLAMLLAIPALAAEPLDAAKRQEDLDFLYEEILVNSHPNAFANTPESEFLAVKTEIEERLETASNMEFLLDLMRLTALVQDSHTMVSVGNGAAFRAYLGVSDPNPESGRQGPIPAALAQGWEQAAVTRAWDMGLLPTDADFSKGLTRAQGIILVEALLSRLNSTV